MRPRLPLILSLLAAGCGKVVGDLPVDGNPGTADARPGDAGSPFPQGSIRRLRTSPPALNAQVTLTNVVVIGHVTARTRAEIYVQDMGISGPNSALRLGCAYAPTCNLRAQDIDDLEIGTVLTSVTGRYDVSMPEGTAPHEPQLLQVQVTVGTQQVQPVAEMVTAELVKQNNATSPMVAPRLASYVRLVAPITITDVEPPTFQGTCDLTPDGGAAELIYLGTLAASGGSPILLQLGAIDGYCRSQCLHECTREAMNGDTLSSVGGVLLVVPSGTMPDLFIRPSREMDVQFP